MSLTGAGIEWASDWFDPFATPGKAVFGLIQAGMPLPDALNQQCAALLASEGDARERQASTPLKFRPSPCFVPQPDLPTGTAYEQHIFNTGRVPTRDNLHDFFNGLCWLRFPLTKRRLNQLQAAEIAQMGVQQVRGPVRDALTLFDENAALLQAPDDLWRALLARDWRRLFIDLRPLWVQARLVLFGHALLEKLVDPYKSITAHVYRSPVPLPLGDGLAAWDVWLAERLSAPELAGKPFTPLPVLGVPGWWAANENPGFYDDVSVFRGSRA